MIWVALVGRLAAIEADMIGRILGPHMAAACILDGGMNTLPAAWLVLVEGKAVTSVVSTIR